MGDFSSRFNIITKKAIDCLVYHSRMLLVVVVVSGTIRAIGILQRSGCVYLVRMYVLGCKSVCPHEFRQRAFGWTLGFSG